VVKADDYTTLVMIMNPEVALAMIGSPQVDEIAQKIAEKLRHVLAAV